ncbi:MAG: transglutaminase-like domain-containing protein [Candidatus Bathyarchaeia archaeon]
MQYATLQSSYDALNAQNVPLQNYTSLKSSYDALISQFSSLQTNYSSLSMQYDVLQASYDSLQNIYNLLISQYDQLRYQINLRSQHYDVTKFVTPNDPSVQQIVNQVTGGWSNPSDWDEFWADVKSLYDWVVNNIPYRGDGLFPVLPSSLSGSVDYRADMWQFPNETLNIKKGDCEDMAILLCSMILCYNGERYWTECVWITSSSSAHVGVQIPVSGGKMVILDPAGPYFTSEWGNIASKDISTEVNNWLNFWKSQGMGNDVRVYRVFADYVDKTFSSTSEYTSWMYSR